MTNETYNASVIDRSFYFFQVKCWDSKCVYLL